VVPSAMPCYGGIRSQSEELRLIVFLRSTKEILLEKVPDF
jgi:hypothetical protein